MPQHDIREAKGLLGSGSKSNILGAAARTAALMPEFVNPLG